MVLNDTGMSNNGVDGDFRNFRRNLRKGIANMAYRQLYV